MKNLEKEIRYEIEKFRKRKVKTVVTLKDEQFDYGLGKWWMTYEGKTQYVFDNVIQFHSETLMDAIKRIRDCEIKQIEITYDNIKK
jgi:hypothetical protein